MASVTMDSSEWEAMKKVEKLLEQSLEREKEQSNKIEALQKENIDTLESNKMSVTIIEEVHISETLQCNRPLDSVMHKLSQYFNSYERGIISHIDVRDATQQMIDLFYTTKHELRTTGEGTRKSVTYKGLDQVKKELEKQMSKAHKEEQKEAKRIFKQHNKINDKLKEGKHEIKIANRVISELEQDVKTLDNTIRKNNNRHKEEMSQTVPSVIVKRTREAIESGKAGWYSRKIAFKKLIDIWKKS